MKSKARIARELLAGNVNLENASEIARKHALIEAEVNEGVEIFVRAAQNQRNIRRQGWGNVVSLGRKQMNTRHNDTRTIPAVGIRFFRERELNPAVQPSVGG
jgi:hypothetical protein